MTLGKKLKISRIVADLLQREVAEKIGISKNYICLLEAGKRKPSLSVLRRLAEVYGTTLTGLLEGVEFEEGGER